MTTTTFDQRLALYLRAGFSLVVIDTAEEQRALDKIARVAADAGRRCITWDAACGFRSLADGQQMALERQPQPALERINQITGPAVFVLKDFHDCWDDAMTKRVLKEQAHRLRGSTQTIVVIGAHARVPAELADDAAVLHLLLPDAAELRALLAEVAIAHRVGKPSEEEVERLVQAALGLSAAQARRIFAKAIVSDGTLQGSDIALIQEEKRELIRTSGLLEFRPPSATVEDVGGLAVLKDWLRLRHRAFSAEAVAYGLPAPRGIALIGIPGTGKSLTAKTIGDLWGLPLLRLDVGALYGSLVGESESRARDALRLAEAVAPCVLWIDEMEKALAHGGNDTGTSTRVFGTILTWMAEKTAPCFVVATANDIAALPPELLRRGRFDEIFFLDLPTTAERRDIFSVHLRKRCRDPQAFDLDALAAATDGYVGAEIEQTVIEALYVAFDQHREPTTEDIKSAASRQIPMSVSQRETVAALRSWLRQGRAVSASAAEA